MSDASAYANQKPMVTVVCITYKHENYIRQALDSFLMQKTNFPFKIFVGEDNGPDGTADIVKEYAEKYPDKIVAFLRKENMGAQKNLVDMCNKAESPYIAFCEGDDYWIDEYKLQKQFDLMEEHPELSACFAETQILADENWYLNGYYKPNKDGIRTIPGSIPGYKKRKILTMDYYIKYGPAHTSSMFFRWNYDLKIPDWYYTHLYGDHPMMMMQVGDGLLGYLPDVMSVYRRSDVGVLMNDDIVEHFVNTRESWIDVTIDLEKYFRENYGDFANAAIKNRMIEEFTNYINFLFKRGDEHLLPDVFAKYPYPAYITTKRLLETQKKYKAFCKNYDKNELKYIKNNPKDMIAEIKRLNKPQEKEKTAKKLEAIKDYFSFAKVKKDPNLWVFTSESKKYDGNTRHLFEYVIAKHPEIKAVWLTANDNLKKYHIAENLPIYKTGTKKAKRLLKKAEYVFVNRFRTKSCKTLGFNAGNKVVRIGFGSGLYDPTKLLEYNKKATMLSDDILPNENDSSEELLKKKELFHKKAYSRELYKKTYLYVVPNNLVKEKLMSFLELDESHFFVCGNPRTTALGVNLLDKNQRNVLYAVKSRYNFVDTEGVIQSFVRHAEEINDFAKNNNFQFYIHIENDVKAKLGAVLQQRIKNYENLHIIYGDIYTTLNDFDVLITDYSDALTDFSLSGKPIISLFSDYRRTTFNEPLLYDYESIFSGKIYRHWADLFPALKTALDTGEPTYSKENVSVFFDEDVLCGDNCEKIVNYIKSLNS